MKRLLFLLICASLILSITGCSTTKPGQPKTNSQVSTGGPDLIMKGFRTRLQISPVAGGLSYTEIEGEVDVCNVTSKEIVFDQMQCFFLADKRIVGTSMLIHEHTGKVLVTHALKEGDVVETEPQKEIAIPSDSFVTLPVTSANCNFGGYTKEANPAIAIRLIHKGKDVGKFTYPLDDIMTLE